MDITVYIFRLGAVGLYAFTAWSVWSSYQEGDWLLLAVSLAFLAFLLWLAYYIVFEPESKAEKEYHEINNILHGYSDAHARELSHMIMTGSNDWTLANKIKADETAFRRTIEVCTIRGGETGLRYKR